MQKPAVPVNRNYLQYLLCHESLLNRVLEFNENFWELHDTTTRYMMPESDLIRTLKKINPRLARFKQQSTITYCFENPQDRLCLLHDDELEQLIIYLGACICAPQISALQSEAEQQQMMEIIGADAYYFALNNGQLGIKHLNFAFDLSNAFVNIIYLGICAIKKLNVIFTNRNFSTYFIDRLLNFVKRYDLNPDIVTSNTHYLVNAEEEEKEAEQAIATANGSGIATEEDKLALAYLQAKAKAEAAHQSQEQFYMNAAIVGYDNDGNPIVDDSIFINEPINTVPIRPNTSFKVNDNVYDYRRKSDAVFQNVPLNPAELAAIRENPKPQPLIEVTAEDIAKEESNKKQKQIEAREHRIHLSEQLFAKKKDSSLTAEKNRQSEQSEQNEQSEQREQSDPAPKTDNSSQNNSKDQNTTLKEHQYNTNFQNNYQPLADNLNNNELNQTQLDQDDLVDLDFSTSQVYELSKTILQQAIDPIWIDFFDVD